jgi:DNA-binding MarR family transcriptional regulator
LIEQIPGLTVMLAFVINAKSDGGPDEELGWEGLVSHLLWETATRLNLRGEAALAGTPLSLPALGLLDFISSDPGITVAEISRRTPKAQQTISQVLSRMEKLGFVERRLRAGRGVGLYLTAAGEAAHVQASSREDELEAFLHDGLGAVAYEQLRSLLHRTRQLLLSG